MGRPSCFPRFALFPPTGIRLAKVSTRSRTMVKSWFSWATQFTLQTCSSMPHRSRLNSTSTKSSLRFSGSGCLQMRRKKATWSLSLTCTSRASGTYGKMEIATVGSRCPTRMTQPNIDEPRRRQCVALPASSKLHQHLSEVLALEQLEKGCGRVLDAVVDGFPPCDLAFAYPRGHLSLELGHEIEIVRDVEALKPKALAHDEHEVARPVGQPNGVVLRDHSADRKAGKRVGCRECRLQVLAADIFETNIDARGRHMQQGFGQIARHLVVDDVVGTDVPDKGTFGRAACRSDDRVPLELGDLACDRSDGTGGGRNEHHVTGFRYCDLEQADPGRQPWHAGNAQECLGREPGRIELLQACGRCVEPYAPAEPGGDQIARLESRIVGSRNFADRPALQRFTDLEVRAPAVHGRVRRCDLPDRASGRLLARLGRRRINRAIGHAATHIRIHRHPEVLYLNFARRRAGHRHRDELEIFGTGHADKSGFQSDFTRRDHARTLSTAAWHP